MHTATLFATALLASVSSARPLVVIDPLDDRSGSWRSNMVVAAPVMLYKAPVAASAFLAVANATAPANVNVLIERGPATVYNPRSRRPDTRPGFPGRSALQASSTTSGSTQEVDAPGPSSTARTCALSSDCGGVARPVNTNAYCDQTTGTCSWRCNSKSALINGVCVARNEQVASTTAPETVPTTTTTSQVAATTTTTAPRESFTGQATYFFQNGNPGACGVWNKDSTPLVALDYRLYGNMGVQSPDCGRSLTITNTANGKSVVAIAQDACPSCESKYSLDLSTGAFDAIGDRDTGILPITWYWNN